MTESVPSDGGFLVPTDYASRLHAVSLENEIVMPRVFLQPMISNTIKLAGHEHRGFSSSLYGGFTASYVAETGEISTANPKTRQMELKAKKLTGDGKMPVLCSQEMSAITHCIFIVHRSALPSAIVPAVGGPFLECINIDL